MAESNKKSPNWKWHEQGSGPVFIPLAAHDWPRSLPLGGPPFELNDLEGDLKAEAKAFVEDRLLSEGFEISEKGKMTVPAKAHRPGGLCPTSKCLLCANTFVAEGLDCVNGIWIDA